MGISLTKFPVIELVARPKMLKIHALTTQSQTVSHAMSTQSPRNHRLSVGCIPRNQDATTSSLWKRHNLLPTQSSAVYQL